MEDVMTKEEQNEYKIIADQCERLATQFHALASGRIKPHTEDAKFVGIMARNLIRLLVNDWM
jgi:hypothetical protein